MMYLAQAFVNGCFPLGLAWKVCEKGGVYQGPCPPFLCDGAWGGERSAVGVRAVKAQGCSAGAWMDGAAGLWPTVTRSRPSCQHQTVC